MIAAHETKLKCLINKKVAIGNLAYVMFFYHRRCKDQAL